MQIKTQQRLTTTIPFQVFFGYFQTFNFYIVALRAINWCINNWNLIDTGNFIQLENEKAFKKSETIKKVTLQKRKEISNPNFTEVAIHFGNIGFKHSKFVLKSF